MCRENFGATGNPGGDEVFRQRLVRREKAVEPAVVEERNHRVIGQHPEGRNLPSELVPYSGAGFHPEEMRRENRVKAVLPGIVINRLREDGVGLVNRGFQSRVVDDLARLVDDAEDAGRFFDNIIIGSVHDLCRAVGAEGDRVALFVLNSA